MSVSPEPRRNPDLSDRYPTASARLAPAGIAPLDGDGVTLFAFLKNPRTIVLCLVALVETILLAAVGRSPWLILPLLALGALGASWRARGWIAGTLALLIAGGAAIYFVCGLKTFVAFAYPAVFASIVVTAQLQRMMGVLITLVLLFGGATFLLDTRQQEISYGDKKVIVLASMWASGERKQPIYDGLIAEFEKLHPEYKVAVRYDGRWVLSKNRPRLLTKKDVPDIIEGSKEELRILAQENYALPLDAWMEAPSATTGKPWREDWIAAIGKLGRYNLKPRGHLKEEANPLDGKMLMAGGIVYHMLFFYNKALLKQLGVEKLPQTWAEFRVLCDKAKAQGITPIMLDSAYQDMISDVLMVNALPEGELRRTVTGAEGAKPFTDPAYIRIFQLERDFADRYFQPGWQACQWPAAQQDFATGKGLFVLCGSWLPGELRQVAVKDKSKFELGCMPIPRFDDQPAGTFNIDISGWMVLKDGNQTEGARLLLQFFTDRWGREIALRDGNPVSHARAPLPPDLAEVEADIKQMKRAANEPVAEYGAQWKARVYMQLHRNFVQAKPGEAHYISPEKFAQDLQDATDVYRARGGERFYE